MRDFSAAKEHASVIADFHLLTQALSVPDVESGDVPRMISIGKRGERPNRR